MTLADALTERDLIALRGLLDDQPQAPAPAILLEQLRRLFAATSAVLLERGDAGQAIVCSAGPLRDLPTPRAQLRDPRSDEHTITALLGTRSGVETWLAFTRDDPPFTDADRITLTLLHPHLVAIHRRDTERRHGGRDLTKRQQEVLRLVARGYRNDEIAQRLVLSAGTVRKHLDNVYRQLGVSSRAAAVARAFPEGVTPY